MNSRTGRTPVSTPHGGQTPVARDSRRYSITPNMCSISPGVQPGAAVSSGALCSRPDASR